MKSSRILFSAVFCLAFVAQSGAKPPNVLFIAVDDLRPQLACYGKSHMQTPNFDLLAKRSVLFERAYCMVPTCGASRAALMTGMRPHPQRFKGYTARADKDTPNAVTLNTHFKSNGYTTISLGKIFHYVDDNASGWSEKPWRPAGQSYQDTARQKASIAAQKKKYPGAKRAPRGPAFESADQPDRKYRDHQTASKAIGYLERFSDSEKPFFLAVGFFKPHLPFIAPKKYYDMYDFDSIDVPDNYAIPKNIPRGAAHESGELRAYSGIPASGPVDRETARHLIHGYYACVSFIDAQLGRLLETLDEKGLADNTIIVLWGDHGWQLGEHGMWNKHSCFETSMHAPLFVSAPGYKPGTRVKALTEFIDVYPTLCDLAGIDSPSQLHGMSLTKLMKDPNLPGKPFAVGRYKNGDTIRGKNFRYSEYRGKTGVGQMNGRMLYDHRSDKDENHNAARSEANQSTVKLLSKKLNQIKAKP